jgi:hypothetical protein
MMLALAGTGAIRFVAAQTRISVAINVGLSLAFFVALFGWFGTELSWWEPDHLAFDFVPQGLAIGVMSALVPGLVARRRLAPSTPLAKMFRIVALGALAGLFLAACATGLVAASGAAVVSYPAAAAIKAAWGALLGLLVTPWAVRSVLNQTTRRGIP